MLEAFHFRHQVGPVDDRGRRTSAGQHDLHTVEPAVQKFMDLGFGQNPEMESRMNLVQDNKLIAAGQHGPETGLQSFAAPQNVVLGDSGRPENQSLATELSDDDERAEFGRGPDLSGRPLLEELADENPHPVARSPQGQSEGGRRFSLAVARVDLNPAAEVRFHGTFVHVPYCHS